MTQRARYIYKDHLFHLSIFLMGILLYLTLSPFIKDIVYILFIAIYLINVIYLKINFIYPEMNNIHTWINDRFKWIKEMLTILLSFIVIKTLVIGYEDGLIHWLFLILTYIEAHMLVDLWYKLTFLEKSNYRSNEEKFFMRFMHAFNFLGLVGVLLTHHYMESFYSLNTIIEVHLSYIIFIALPSYFIKYGVELYKVYV